VLAGQHQQRVSATDGTQVEQTDCDVCTNADCGTNKPFASGQVLDGFPDYREASKNPGKE